MHQREFDDDNDGHTTNNYLDIQKLQIHEEIADSETIAFSMHVLLLPRFPYSVIYLCWKASGGEQEANPPRSNIGCDEGMAGFLVGRPGRKWEGLPCTVLIAG